MNRELTLQDNLIVTEPIVTEYCTTGATRISIKSRTAGAAKQPTEHPATVVEHATKHKVKHAALHTPTEDITSAARKTIDISMIGAAPFSHLVQLSQSQKDSRI